MAEESLKPKSGIRDPQVLTALITGIVSVTVAIVSLVPTMIAANTPTATPTLTHTATFTLTPSLTATATTQASAAPTLTFNESKTPLAPTVSATTEPLQVEPTIEIVEVQPTVEVAQAQPTALSESQETPSEPNVLLIFDEVSFTLVNVSGSTLSLKDLKFRSDSGKWDAKTWGGPTVYNALPNDLCLRIRDSAAGNRNPPGECKDLHGLSITGGDALFWRGVGEFEIRQKKDLLASCKTDTDRCAIFVPQD